MDKIYDVKKIQAGCKAASVPEVFKKEGIAYQQLTCVNWPEEYPYMPDVRFALAYDGGNILVHYIVKEKTTGAAATEDFGSVWQDSCAEFFFSPDGKGYYNFECNCIGTLLFCYGQDRNGRVQAPKEAVGSIDRWTTLPHAALPEAHVDCWEAALVIPASALFRHNLASFDGLDNASANIYKCGDALSTVHFLSWAPITTPAPDFHRPEFFRPIHFGF